MPHPHHRPGDYFDREQQQPFDRRPQPVAVRYPAEERGRRKERVVNYGKENLIDAVKVEPAAPVRDANGAAVRRAPPSVER